MPLKFVGRKGSDFIYLRGTIKGQRVFESTGTGDEGIAEEIRAQREAELYKRAIYGARAVITFAEAAASYLETEPRSPSTCARVARLILHFGPMKGLAAIDQVAIDGAVKALCLPGAAPATKIRGVITPTRAILMHGARRKWCDLPVFEMPAVAGARTDFLLPHQASALVQAAANHLRPLLVFQISTGCRMSEAFDLTWEMVDLRGARARVWQKQDTERQVHLHPVAIAALAGLKNRDGHVFRPFRRGPVRDASKPDRYHDSGRAGGGQISTGWTGACRRAGLPAWTPHVMRHTWASAHYAMNLDPLRLMRDGGWSTLKMVERYAHLMPATYAAEWRTWLAGGANLVQAAAG